MTLRLVAFFLVCISTSSAWAFEGLDEMMRRRAQLDAAVWGGPYLEDSSTYRWQAETLWYVDQATGHEVWVVARTPRAMDIFAKSSAPAPSETA